ncbi:peptidoglycan D,D-transpeptidase FtsI family protein [Pseudoruegeria sp. SHC-113]|uniref:peptidoglycan D,D-transpeptidase FtsI family protein n=1 Tax=Pseudoruegeria sp. SHC-113 TaxID=2855439 RepID=UPI0021BBA229|nr:penicillin-binding protein 2 [Pseudoruegeria sp. SHC-113]MCT8161043.1 penicillin-binding protein 2 [Pseudoruegeria sp. SHC-113]
MTRIPLRPLARILEARAKGENPDAIEKENIRQRHEEMRDKARNRAEGRLLVLGAAFVCAFALVGVRMAHIASIEPREPRAAASGSEILAQRSDIVDRNGNVLATNLFTHSLYAQPPIMIDKERAARELVKIFPDLKEERLVKDFTGKRKFLWIKKKISPEQMQAVHDIGDPGLMFGPREMRLYPNGKLAAHILGGASFGREGVHSAEVVGVAGVEKIFDDYLRDPANQGAPLQLSIDLTVQAAMRHVLNGGMQLMQAKGATGIILDAHTGEIIAMTSLPDFDPNNRPRPAVEGSPSDSPLFNRAVQGVYELGSTFKIFTAAQAIEERLVNASTMVDTTGPMTWGRHRIRDFKNYGPQLSVTDVIVKSSNIGTARMAMMIGTPRQQEFMKKLGFFEPTEVELVEGPSAKPLLPKNWSDISTMTISYGHGLSASPLHLAAGYASVLNGGTRITPTILRQEGPQRGERVVSAQTSAILRDMLRQVVDRGTASFGKVEGYSVGGKTGTADKPKETGGGYYKDRVIATFASVFPTDDPKYVVIVTLDEPKTFALGEERRTAGWTAVPVAAELIERTAPLLGVRPQIAPLPEVAITLTSN